MIFSLKREVARHNLEWNVAAHVGEVFVTATDALHSTDHFKPDVIEKNGSSNRRPSGKKVPRQFVAEDNHVAFLSFVQTIQPSPLLERKIPDLVVLGLHAGNLPVGAGKLADGPDVIAEKHRRSIAYVGSLLADVHIVLAGEQIFAGRIHAPGDCGSAAGEDKHNVLAEFR